MSRKEKFLEILRKYGVKRYWQNEEFNPDEAHPKGRLAVETDNMSVMSELSLMYLKDMENYPEIVEITRVSLHSVKYKTSHFINDTEGLYSIDVQ